jgi:RimJ/RimL family protein N-acetyltransferase
MMSDGKVGPLTLQGKYVRLEPLRPQHAERLFEAAKLVDWDLMLGPLRTREAVDARIEHGLRGEEKDAEYAFAVILREGDLVIGSTAYLAVVSKHRRLEIGSTWYVPERRGTAVNPECKYLLLKHAFEDWGAVRVQLGTDARNIHSQRAIVKLGAKFEGRLRNHGVMPDGTVRDAMLYSIIAQEWPEVKAGLQTRIASFADQRDLLEVF